MSTTDKSGKRPESSALDILNRVKPEDPVERMQRLEKEIRERRAFQLRTKGVLAEIRRLLNSLEEELFPHESTTDARAPQNVAAAGFGILRVKGD